MMFILKMKNKDSQKSLSSVLFQLFCLIACVQVVSLFLSNKRYIYAQKLTELYIAGLEEIQ